MCLYWCLIIAIKLSLDIDTDHSSFQDNRDIFRQALSNLIDDVCPIRVILDTPSPTMSPTPGMVDTMKNLKPFYSFTWVDNIVLKMVLFFFI